MKTFLVIQGHTKHVDQMLKIYRDVENVIWATDVTMPHEDLEKIQSSSIKLVTILSINPGYGNINLQTQSTLAGVQLAKSLGATHCMKIRSDLSIKEYNRLLKCDIFNNKLGFLCYRKHLHLFSQHIRANAWINQQYNINNENCNYVLDFLNYGPIDDMLLFWDYYEHQSIPVITECKLQFNYLAKKGYKLANDFEYFTDIFNFLILTLQRENIDLFSLKWGNSFTTLHYTNGEDGRYIPQHYKWTLDLKTNKFFNENGIYQEKSV